MSPYTHIPTPVVEWAAALILAFPAATIVLGEAAVQLRRRGKALATTLGILRNLVLPSLAIDLLLGRVVGLEPGHPTLKVALTALYITLIHAGLSLLNVVVFADAAEGSWQSRLPKLLLDLIRGVLVLAGAGVVLSTVWEINLSSLAAAFGVGSLVIGLALQGPLGSLFAGIVLLIGRPFRLGDTIRFGASVGKVVDINFRAVCLESGGGELLILPSADLSKSAFSNLSRPSRRRTDSLDLVFGRDDPPNTVKRILKDVALRSAKVLDDPAPTVRTAGFKDGSVAYTLSITVDDFGDLADVRDEILTRIWYVARRQGLTIPYPSRDVLTREHTPADARRAPDPEVLLHAFPTLTGRDPATAGDLAAHVTVKSYGQGERVTRPGDTIAGLNLVLSGHASLTVADAAGGDREIARVGRGDYFGEGSLLSGVAGDVAVTATEDLDVLVLDADALQRLLDRSPRLAREIGTVMDVRRAAARAARMPSRAR